MAARLHTRPGPADRSGEIQLRWWAVALPSAAFAVLLLLILNPTDAHAAATGPSLAHILQGLQQSVLHRGA